MRSSWNIMLAGIVLDGLSSFKPTSTSYLMLEFNPARGVDINELLAEIESDAFNER
jgi:hypothetical protein